MPNIIDGGFMKNRNRCTTSREEPRQFIVEVTHEDGMWTAVCDELGLVTEAKTYEALTERVWDIAPELCSENNLCDSNDEEFSIEFIHEQSYRDSRMAL